MQLFHHHVERFGQSGFEHVLALSPGNAWRFKRQNAAFNVFVRTDDAWTLETWNDTSPLDALGSLDEPPSL